MQICSVLLWSIVGGTGTVKRIDILPRLKRLGFWVDTGGCLVRGLTTTSPHWLMPQPGVVHRPKARHSAPAPPPAPREHTEEKTVVLSSAFNILRLRLPETTPSIESQRAVLGDAPGWYSLASQRRADYCKCTQLCWKYPLKYMVNYTIWLKPGKPLISQVSRTWALRGVL
jgi:hypothetical protein